jgi:hypothetical protein
MTDERASKDRFTLNEIRIPTSELRSIRVRKYRFDRAHKRRIGSPLRKGGYVPVFSGDTFFVMTTKQQPDGATFDDYFDEELGLELEDEVGFLELKESIQRRFITTLMKEGAARGIAQSGPMQYFETGKTLFKNAYDACNIDIRIYEDHFSIFIDPTVLILLPVTSVSLAMLEGDRTVIKLVNKDDIQRLKEWGHSPYPAKIGYFSRLGDSVATISEETAILVKRSPKAAEEFRYPAFALHLIARREEVRLAANQIRSHIRPLACFRLNRTREWVDRFFADNKLIVNDRMIGAESKVVSYYEPAVYGTASGSQALIYPETALLFDRVATKTNTSQLWGLIYHKPFDHNDGSRTFTEIRPWIIVPYDEPLVALVRKLCGFLANEYPKRDTAPLGDLWFKGLKSQFGVPLVPPSDQDILRVNGSVESYVARAEDLLMKWKQEGSDPSRIVLVIVPDLYGDIDEPEDAKQETDDPYLHVKKLFVEGGLPCQMVEYNTLYDIEDTEVGYGYTVWTLALDMYVKLGGKPWTLDRPLGNVNCLIGIGFGRDSDALRNQLYVGVANVFDEAGQWLSVSSEDRELGKEDIESIKEREYWSPETPSFKIKEEVTRQIVDRSLRLYLAKPNAQLPEKVVLHKNGRLYDSEAAGFLSAVVDHAKSIEQLRLGLVSIYKSNDLRMYGPPAGSPEKVWRLEHTVTRGCAFIFDESCAVIATTGKVYEVPRGRPEGSYSYKGIGTPDPLIIERNLPSQDLLGEYGLNESNFYSIEELCEHVLALTKLHWGTMRQDIRLPVTSLFSQRIARFMAKAEIRAEESLKWTKPWWI